MIDEVVLTGLWVITPELPATNLSSSYQLLESYTRELRETRERAHEIQNAPLPLCVGRF
mgnify:CR=1 FL=1